MIFFGLDGFRIDKGVDKVVDDEVDVLLQGMGGDTTASKKRGGDRETGRPTGL